MRSIPKPLILLLLLITFIPKVDAMPSGGGAQPSFTYRSGYWYDAWGISRNYAEGSDGYLPQLFSETTDTNKELAYSIGVGFQDSYPDSNSMAAAILKYVQSGTEYGYDSDNVVMRGVAQDEWAWNADEMAHRIDTTIGIAAVGDCEDLAFLSATIYNGAGIETALVDAPGHVALLIWLPDYPNANQYWELTGDSRGAGWIWVEATGTENPLGWTPSDFFDGDWYAYTLDDGVYNQREPTQAATDFGSGTDLDSIDLELILTIVFILFIIVSRVRRR